MAIVCDSCSTIDAFQKELQSLQIDFTRPFGVHSFYVCFRPPIVELRGIGDIASVLFGSLEVLHEWLNFEEYSRVNL